MVKTQEELLRVLDENGIPYTNHKHPAVYTVEEAALYHEGIDGVHSKNLFLQDKKKNLFLVVTLSDKNIVIKEMAKKIGHHLVEDKLAACVQVSGPITSIYQWENKMEESQEWRCLIKTRKDLYPELEAAIRGNHPYDVPEIIALPLLTGSQDYLDWIDQVVKPEHKPLV